MLLSGLTVYVINLDRAKERMSMFDRRCKEIGQKYIRVSAVDKNDIVPRSDGYRSGHEACYRSHYNLWKRILGEGLTYACILEDDAYLMNPIDNIECDESFDLLFISARVNQNDRLEVVDGCGTEGYIVSRQGCKNLLKICEKINVPVDLRIFAHIKTYINTAEFMKRHRSPEYYDFFLKALRSRIPFVKHLNGYSYIDDSHKD